MRPEDGVVAELGHIRAACCIRVRPNCELHKRMVDTRAAATAGRRAGGTDQRANRGVGAHAAVAGGPYGFACCKIAANRHTAGIHVADAVRFRSITAQVSRLTIGEVSLTDSRARIEAAEGVPRGRHTQAHRQEGTHPGLPKCQVLALRTATPGFGDSYPLTTFGISQPPLSRYSHTLTHSCTSVYCNTPVHRAGVGAPACLFLFNSYQPANLSISFRAANRFMWNRRIKRGSARDDNTRPRERDKLQRSLSLNWRYGNLWKDRDQKHAGGCQR